MNTLFAAEAISTSERSGTIRTLEGLLNVTLGNPLEKDLEKHGPNPEWLTRTQGTQGQIGQRMGSSPSFSTALTPLGVSSSAGTLVFVPSTHSGAGTLKVASHTASAIYTIPCTPDGSGTYTLGTASLAVTIPGVGPEGLVYVPIGSRQFTQPSILVCEYGTSKVAAFDIDSQGNPIVSSSRDFVTGLGGVLGAVIDPRTGDFLFSTFGANNRIISVQGFTAVLSITAQPVSQTVSVASSASFSVTATGTAPMAYQWRFNSGVIDGATTTNYSLSAMTTNNTGDYTVVITNAQGSLTSSVATLTVNRISTTTAVSGSPNPYTGLNALREAASLIICI